MKSGMRGYPAVFWSGVIFGLVLFAWPAQAQILADSDGDGLPDAWEENVFRTDPRNRDSDGDGYPDRLEIEQGYDPSSRGKMASGDADKDGLADRLELLFGTDPQSTDSDGDGKEDGREVASGYDPASTSTEPLPKEIVIRLKTQELDQVLGRVVVATYRVSTGRPGFATPPGEYRVMNKNPRAWSSRAKLWMPWWMQFSKNGMGLHELPEWPNGRKEGEKSLGTPASGGCVRLGVGPAKKLYDWTPVGTAVKVVR